MSSTTADTTTTVGRKKANVTMDITIVQQITRITRLISIDQT